MSTKTVETGIGETGATTVLDVAALLERVDGDRSFALDVLGTFREQATANVAAILCAAADKDGARMHREAHTLRGAAANVGAKNLSSLAARFQALADCGGFTTALAQWRVLTDALGACAEAIEGYRQHEDIGC